ncbi:NAD-dependent protein deacetylase [Angustibacter sp. McL0619]|uniref:NAD-dependent protein deacetylase n=1 Tax=Angustibacter sp. McL0619 TaxID=3415676 RepID=UPI003CEFD5D0
MHDLRAAFDLLAGRRVVVLTGAGLSTDSGIPDYRGPSAVPRQPMTHQEFVSGPAAQQRYWARSHVGWARMRQAQPNEGHLALARLERSGAVAGLITQNVDGLHGAAGSRTVIDLHGRIDEVVCLRCDEITSRATLHERLTEHNPGFGAGVDARIAPDGDAEVLDVEHFRLASCLVCRGALMPHVVFFGANVPKDRVERSYAMVEGADVLLVAGTSLTVQSGLRFVRRAAREAIPVVLVNRGPTRGDDLVTVKVDAGCSPTLSRLSAALCGLEGSRSPRTDPDRARTA